MDFIVSKLVVRPIVASLVPLSLYSTIYSLDMLQGFKYDLPHQQIFCLIIMLCCLYPLNYIGLYILFKPISIMLEAGIMKAREAQGADKKPNPIL